MLGSMAARICPARQPRFAARFAWPRRHGCRLGRPRRDTSAEPRPMRRSRDRHQLVATYIEAIGAGEGNRTLVFSLEGVRQLNTFKARSDKSYLQARLNWKQLFWIVRIKAARRSLLTR